MTKTTETATVSPLVDDLGYDPIEDRLRETVRTTIEAMFEEDLSEFPGRVRYDRAEER